MTFCWYCRTEVASGKFDRHCRSFKHQRQLRIQQELDEETLRSQDQAAVVGGWLPRSFTSTAASSNDGHDIYDAVANEMEPVSIFEQSDCAEEDLDEVAIADDEFEHDAQEQDPLLADWLRQKRECNDGDEFEADDDVNLSSSISLSWECEQLRLLVVAHSISYACLDDLLRLLAQPTFDVKRLPHHSAAYRQIINQRSKPSLTVHHHPVTIKTKITKSKEPLPAKKLVMCALIVGHSCLIRALITCCQAPIFA